MFELAQTNVCVYQKVFVPAWGKAASQTCRRYFLSQHPRFGRKPADCRSTNPKKLANFGLGPIAGDQHLKGLGLLLCAEFGAIPADPPFSSGSCQSQLRPFPQDGSFKFSEGAKHLSQHPADARRRIACFGETAKPGFAVLKSLQDMQKIG